MIELSIEILLMNKLRHGNVIDLFFIIPHAMKSETRPSALLFLSTTPADIIVKLCGYMY